VLFEIGDRRLEIMPSQTLRRGETGIDRDMVLLIDRAENIRDPAFDRGGCNPIGGIIGFLFLAPAIGLRHRSLDRSGFMVGIEDHLAIDIAGRAANRLNKRRFAAQKSFLVGVKNGDKSAFGNVEPLAQKMSAMKQTSRISSVGVMFLVSPEARFPAFS
jgi:hypothetical protein